MAILDNCEAFWELGDLVDAHGNNDLTNNGTVTFSAAKVGNGAEILSSGQSLTIADNASLSSGNIDFSGAGWFKFNNLNVTHILCQKADQIVFNADMEWVTYLSDNDQKVYFKISDGTNGLSVGWGTAASTATWYFIAWGHDAANDKIWISVNAGTKVLADWSTGSFDSNFPFRIGNDTGDRVLAGMADQLGFWKRVLSDSDLSYLYNAGNGRSYADLSGPQTYTASGSLSVSAVTASGAATFSGGGEPAAVGPVLRGRLISPGRIFGGSILA